MVASYILDMWVPYLELNLDQKVYFQPEIKNVFVHVLFLEMFHVQASLFFYSEEIFLNRICVLNSYGVKSQR